MPRPRKRRRVCGLPDFKEYGPIDFKDNEGIVTMTVEEYEAIRLIDLEEMDQEHCAEKMNVARSTVQRIYNDARKKVADSIVNGKFLKIEGGDYKVCEDDLTRTGCGICHRHRRGRVDF